MEDLFILSWDTKKNIYCVLIGPYVVVDGNFVIRALTILIINIRIGSVNQFFAVNATVR